MEIVEDPGERYRHEMLIEAVRPDGSRWALTGSPDLSVRALLTPAGKGGNIEVGVVARPVASLFPEATRPLPLEEVLPVRLPGSAQARQADGAVLLAAARAEGGLEVALARATAWPTPLEASRADGPGGWVAIGSVPPAPPATCSQTRTCRAGPGCGARKARAALLGRSSLSSTRNSPCSG